METTLLTSPDESSATERVGIARPLIVFLVFAIAGPLVGGVFTIAVLLIAMSQGPDGPLLAGGMEEFEKAAILFVKIVYFVGGLQAVFVALVALLATVLRWGSRASFLAVVVASLVAGIGFVSLMVSNSNTPFLSVQSFISLGVHVATGIVCWLIAHGILRLFGKALLPKGN